MSSHFPHRNQITEFGNHVLGHSAAGESWALHPPGCALRAYGCRACRATTTTSTAADGRSRGGCCGDVGGGGDTISGPRRCLSGSGGMSHSSEAGAAAVGATATKAVVIAQGAAAGAGAKTMERFAEKDGTEKSGAGEEAGGKRGHGHDSPGTCPWYRVVCKSCEQEVTKKGFGQVSLSFSDACASSPSCILLRGLVSLVPGCGWGVD